MRLVLLALSTLAACRTLPPTSSEGKGNEHVQAPPISETDAPMPTAEADGRTWFCFAAQSRKGDTFDHCLRVAADCEALVVNAQADDRFVADTPKCEPQARAHCMTTPRGETHCMADSDRCDRSFKHSIAAVSGWWGAATACTALRPDDTMPVTKMEPAFAGGDCVLAKDGYIWMITRVEDGEYYSTGWQGNGWGNMVHFEVGHFESLGYQRTECPELTR